MDIVSGLMSKKNEEAFKLLLQLEARSAETPELYGYFDEFVSLLNSKSSFVRVRGFRLACAQAQWDTEKKWLENADTLLSMLEDDKTTAVRQCLVALHSVALYQPELIEKSNAN